jgi:hypothetical protein
LHAGYDTPSCWQCVSEHLLLLLLLLLLCCAAAVVGSLHQRGKGTAHMPLPAGPTKEDYEDKMPASLKRMLALKVCCCTQRSTGPPSCCRV